MELAFVNGLALLLICSSTLVTHPRINRLLDRWCGLQRQAVCFVRCQIIYFYSLDEKQMKRLNHVYGVSSKWPPTFERLRSLMDLSLCHLSVVVFLVFKNQSHMSRHVLLTVIFPVPTQTCCLWYSVIAFQTAFISAVSPNILTWTGNVPGCLF